MATEWITVSAAFAAAAPAIELSYEPLPEGPANEIRKVKKVILQLSFTHISHKKV